MKLSPRIKRLLTGGLTAAMLATSFTVAPVITGSAQAGQWYSNGTYGGGYRYYGPRRNYRNYGYYPRHRYYGHRRHRDYGAAAAAGIIGLGVGAMLGAAASQPNHYYYDAPPRRVYRRDPSEPVRDRFYK